MELVTVPRVTVVGEGMLELRQAGADGWDLGYGGDALNTAIHLARSGCAVRFASALGSDAFSARLRQQWAAEGLDLSLLLEDPDHQAGLYAISLDPDGERSFAYWRGQSAARRMFALPQSAAMAAAASECDLLYFSLITLAILPPEGRDMLFDLAARVRAGGGRIAFDGNYRPGLWPDKATTIAARDTAIASSDIGLPTYDDEAALSGEAAATEVTAHWLGLGCSETMVKVGAEGVWLPNGRRIGPAARLSPVDTSGAGDAFNAGYLAARLAGEELAAAAVRGNALAGWTVMRRGAIPPVDDAAPYPAV